MSRLAQIVSRLKKAYGKPEVPPTKTAFEYYLWDRVGYLFADDKQRAAFAELRKRVGLTPEAILKASPTTLTAVAAMGGIEPAKRASHMREAAEYVVEE